MEQCFSEFGMSDSEIGEHLGIPRDTVISIRKRALVKMRKALIRNGHRKGDLYGLDADRNIHMVWSRNAMSGHKPISHGAE